MSKTKRYFWLKFKEDFFNQKEIKKLRRVAGGDTFTIIYLKMQLLSVKNEGVITFEGTEENLSEQISLEIDEDVDNVKITLEYLYANNLIEKVSEDNFLLNKVPPLIGNETDSAERMRRIRANTSPRLTKASHCSLNVRKSDTELEKEIDKELDTGFAQFWKAYPKKKAKGSAEKAWNKIDSSLLTTILEAIENQKQSPQWKKEGGQYIPYPATWLNSKSWEDEVEVADTQDSSIDLEEFEQWQKEQV